MNKLVKGGNCYFFIYPHCFWKSGRFLAPNLGPSPLRAGQSFNFLCVVGRHSIFYKILDCINHYLLYTVWKIYGNYFCHFFLGVILFSQFSKSDMLMAVGEGARI